MQKRLIRQILALTSLVALFAAFNGGVYLLLTRRLADNFGSASQNKMIELGAYLPFEDASDLARTPASLRLTGDLPVLDGAAALMPVYAAVINAVYPAGSVTYEGGAFSDAGETGENFAPDSVMQYKNTVRGYRSIVDGETDILFCAGPSDEQRQYAADAGVELVYEPIGLEAFVFFVNRNNPVDSLTAEEIRAIYAGEIRNWKDVVGVNRPINPVTRYPGSGSQSMMDAFMKDVPYGRKSPFALAGASIGYSFRYYMDGIIGNDGVKMLCLNNVYPDQVNIRNGTYPLITRFYAIYRADNGNENIPRLIDWLLSEEGQTLIEASGYVRFR